jgi:vacuolar-type H+-ATPase subunit D/Vma8
MNTTDKITHSIVINQIALNNNEAIKHTNFYKKSLKQKLNLLMPELIKCENEYDEFFNKLEDSTSHVYDVYENYTKAVASVPIWDAENITLIIEAYKKDQKSIEGICKKILNR